MFNLSVVLGAGLVGGLLGRSCAAGVSCPGVGRAMTAILVLDVGTTGVRAAVVDGDLTIRTIAPPAVPAGDAVPGAGRVRRRRARPPRARRRRRSHRRRRRADQRRRHHQPAGQHDRVGPQRPASRSARPSAGRTCAPSASAIMRRPSTTSRWPPTSRPPRWPGCSQHARAHATATSCFGTVDTWLAWQLSGGAVHVTDPSNAAVTGLLGLDGGVVERARPAPPRRAAGDAAAPRRLQRRRRRRDGAARRAADRRPRRRPAGLARRPGLRDARARPRSRSAPAGCSTCAAAPAARRRPAAAEHGTYPDRRLVDRRRGDVGRRGDHAVRRHQRRLAARRPRPHRRRPPRATTSRRGARRPTASCTCRRCSASARRSWDYGARGTLFGLTRGTDPRRTSCGPCSRASPTAAPTSSRRPRPTPGSPIDGRPGRRRDERQPDVRPGAGRRHRPRRSRSSPVVEATTIGAAYLAGLATGVWAASPTPIAPGHPLASSSRRPRSTAPRGPRRRTGGRLDPRAVRPRRVTGS